jgi:hypothetical protein
MGDYLRAVSAEAAASNAVQKTQADLTASPVSNGVLLINLPTNADLRLMIGELVSKFELSSPITLLIEDSNRTGFSVVIRYRSKLSPTVLVPIPRKGEPVEVCYT